MKTLKLTPFLIVFGIVEIILVFMTINYLFINNNGGMALGGVIALIAAIIILLIMLIEQSIARIPTLNPKVLWIIESIIISGIIVYISICGMSIG